MKNYFVIAAILLFSTSIIYSQMGIGVTAGAKGGLTFETLSGDNVIEDNIESKTGFSAGGFLDLSFPGLFGVRPEILYVKKGADGTNNAADTDIEYLEIPILVKLNIPVIGPIKPNLFVGPSLAFKIGSEMTTDDLSVNTDDLVESTNFGLVLGAGVDFSVGAGVLTFDARYNWGLSNIWKELDDVKTTGFAIYVGYGFRLNPSIL